jgi:hypothetical protein
MVCPRSFLIILLFFICNTPQYIFSLIYIEYFGIILRLYIEEALKNVQDAIKCWIETAKELRREIPEFDESIKEISVIKGKYAEEILQDFLKIPSDAAVKRNKSALELVKKLKG